MAAPGRFENVRTDSGWHGRITGGNGEKVWTTEVYTDPRAVENAFDVFVASLHHIDAVTFTKSPYPPVTVLDVDERTNTAPHAEVCPSYTHAHGPLCSFACPTCGGKS